MVSRGFYPNTTLNATICDDEIRWATMSPTETRKEHVRLRRAGPSRMSVRRRKNLALKRVAGDSLSVFEYVPAAVKGYGRRGDLHAFRRL